MNSNLNTNEWIERRKIIEKVLWEKYVYIDEGEYRDVEIISLANSILRELGFRPIISSGIKPK